MNIVKICACAALMLGTAQAQAADPTLGEALYAVGVVVLHFGAQPQIGEFDVALGV